MPIDPDVCYEIIELAGMLELNPPTIEMGQLAATYLMQTEAVCYECWLKTKRCEELEQELRIWQRATGLLLGEGDGAWESLEHVKQQHWSSWTDMDDFAFYYALAEAEEEER
jgi:hypothetical protein